MSNLEYESAFGYDAIIGIDEAGRGPLAGGVYAATVRINLDRARVLIENEWKGVNDSKRLSEKKREKFAAIIKSTPDCFWAIASASPKEIDELNILRATHLAMKRAAEQVGAKIKENLPDSTIGILVDGNPVKCLPYPAQNIIKGDAKSLLIAAASILAKTARDADCQRLDSLYPEYGFARHKGYPTKDHIMMLEKFGPTPEHRVTFGPVARVLENQTAFL